MATDDALLRNALAYVRRCRTDSHGFFFTPTPAHRAMLHCIYDVLARIPSDWTLDPIGKDAEAELLNWDAEKYRQMLAERG